MQNELKYDEKYPLKIENNATVFKTYRAITPPYIDLRSKCPPVFDQLQLGSCVANTLVTSYQFNNTKFSGSRLFLYYNSRFLDKSVNIDAGTTISQGINALKKFGICSEKIWTYSDNSTKFKKKPSRECYIEGLKNQVISANAIMPNLNAMKQCLATGFPFALGFMVYDSFESNAVALTGMVPMPKQNEQLLGGHAVLCVGYDDSKRVFIVRNSWGASWGDKGYFYMPYTYLTNRNLAGDFWQVTKVEIPTNKKPKSKQKPKTKPRQKLISKPRQKLISKPRQKLISKPISKPISRRIIISRKSVKQNLEKYILMKQKLEQYILQNKKK
jgi:C1A family cysteine protease